MNEQALKSVKCLDKRSQVSNLKHHKTEKPHFTATESNTSSSLNARQILSAVCESNVNKSVIRKCENSYVSSFIPPERCENVLKKASESSVVQGGDFDSICIDEYVDTVDTGVLYDVNWFQKTNKVMNSVLLQTAKRQIQIQFLVPGNTRRILHLDLFHKVIWICLVRMP